LIRSARPWSPSPNWVVFRDGEYTFVRWQNDKERKSRVTTCSAPFSAQCKSLQPPRMSDTASPSFASIRSLFIPWTSAHTFGVAFALIALLSVLALQVTLLSSWHTGIATPNIPLVPTNAAVSIDAKVNNALSYSFVGVPAVSATQSINVKTDEVLGISLSFDQIAPDSTLTLGWVGIRDRRKPSNLAVKLSASTTPQTIYVPLRGHSSWRDNITQFAVVLVAPPRSPTMTMSNAIFVAATPAAATSHALGSWFDSASQLQPSAVAQRVLPVSLLVALAALIAFAAIGFLKRDATHARRDAMLAATLFLSLFALGLALFAPNAFAFTEALLPWWLASAALGVACFGRFIELPATIARLFPVEIISLVIAAMSLALGGLGFVWVALAVIVLHLAYRFSSLFENARSFLFFAPTIAVGAVVQAAQAKHVDLPGVSFADPSTSVAALIHQSAAFVAIAIVLLLAYTFWPRTIGRGARSGVGVTLWFVLIGTISAFVLRPQDNPMTANGAAWILLPFLITAFAWLSPRFVSPVTTAIAETKIERTENDLSSVVRQLFDGSAASFDAVIQSDHPGGALAPLNRMKEIAPASAITRAAEVRYALKNDKLASARAAYFALKQADASTLSDSSRRALLEYANRSDDFEAVIERASANASSEANCRMIARAQLLDATLDNRIAAQKEALATLESLPKPNSLAHEIAELHLLLDDWQAAQLALVGSPITPQSLSGQIYVARMGFRATGGQSNYVEQIQKLATWNNTLGIAQLAMGELLLAQGNAQGARARFLLARKLDPTLWAAERRIRDIDAASNKQDESMPALVPMNA
jgi:hypothetical protein